MTVEQMRAFLRSALAQSVSHGTMFNDDLPPSARREQVDGPMLAAMVRALLEATNERPQA